MDVGFLVGTLYSWEIEAAAYADLQFTTPGKTLLDDEVNLEDHIAELRQNNKLDRVVTYRHMQTVSHMVSGATHGRVDYDFFMLPDSVHAGAVEQHEVRKVIEGPITDKVEITDLRTGLVKIAIGPEVQDVPLLVNNSDEGPSCTAADAFQTFQGAMIVTVWDRIHRIIRDCKGAYKDACGGIFLKAQVFSAHIWGLNNKPTGDFF